MNVSDFERQGGHKAKGKVHMPWSTKTGIDTEKTLYEGTIMTNSSAESRKATAQGIAL